MSDPLSSVSVVPVSQLRGRLRARAPKALLAAVLTFGAVMGGSLLVTPVYESRASVRIESAPGARGGMEGLSLGSLGSLGGSLGSLGGDAQVVTEMGVLGSRRLLEPMVLHLALHVTVEQPAATDGVRPPLFALLEAGPATVKGELTLTRGSDGRYAVSATGTGMGTPSAARVAPGDTLTVGVVRLVLDAAVTAPEIVLRTRPLTTVMRRIDRTLRIRRDAPGSRLVHLRFRHAETAVAKAFVDGVLAMYLDQAAALVAADPARRVAFLGNQLRAFRTRVDAAERALVAAQQGGPLPPREALEFEAKRQVELTVRRDGLRVELATLDAFLAGNVEPQALLAFPSFFEAGPTGSVLDALLALETRRDSLLVQRTPENREVQLLQARIAALEGTLQTLVREYRGALAQRVTAASTALDSLAPGLTPLPARVVAAERAAKELELLAEVTSRLEQLELQARTEQALARLESRVVDAGTVSDRPVFPRLDLNAALGAVLALLVALLVLLSGAPRPSGETAEA